VFWHSLSGSEAFSAILELFEREISEFKVKGVSSDTTRGVLLCTKSTGQTKSSNPP
jgi:hypothetical protein